MCLRVTHPLCDTPHVVVQPPLPTPTPHLPMLTRCAASRPPMRSKWISVQGPQGPWSPISQKLSCYCWCCCCCCTSPAACNSNSSSSNRQHKTGKSSTGGLLHIGIAAKPTPSKGPHGSHAFPPPSAAAQATDSILSVNLTCRPCLTTAGSLCVYSLSLCLCMSLPLPLLPLPHTHTLQPKGSTLSAGR